MGDIGVKMRSVSFVIGWCFRSVCSHPFLVGFVCFLIYLYRSSPFLFSFLVSASPVLVCTALLLGTLLSFGQVNLPEIELEDKSLHHAASLKTGVSGDSTHFHENDSYYVKGKGYSEENKDRDEQLSEDHSKFSEVRGGNTSDDTGLVVEERSREKDLGDGEVWGDSQEFGDTRYKEKAEWYDGRLSDVEIMENHYSSIPPETNDECVESDDERSEGGSFDSERVNVASLDSPPRSPWKRIEDRDEEEEDVYEDMEDDEGLDSGSDRAESSSPDASMADIMPMLDELHPLLDEDAPQPVPTSVDGSDAASESSSRSSSHESDEDTENDEESEVGEDENEDGEDEQDAQGDKEEHTESAITWTEEDQKNLMDLGSSELERNQRLENLILRRRARKNMSMVPERNLIDLESTDFPFNIAPISTIRQNPFDVSHDSYDNSGLLPIPGSAPSILLPRRNPFDIPYDSSEEKPNLVGDGLQEDFTTFQPREPFQPRDPFQPREPIFRRHESFNVGPSIFAPGRQDRLDVRFRPYFVPERMASDESSYSLFQRQSSELSDSKVSSVPETESLGSVEDLEERKLLDEDNEPELESLPSMKQVTEESPPAEHGMSSNREEVTEEDELQETELISDIAHVSENVGHGSQSSEDEEQEKESLGGEVQASGYHSNSEDERRYSSDSSSSPLSEVSERVFTDTEEVRRDTNGEVPSISTQTSTELRITSTLVDEVLHREPVYDASPPAIRKTFSSSSISSIVHVESDLSLPPVLVKRMVPSVDRESESSSPEDIADRQMLPESSHHPVDEHESTIINVVGKREQDNTNSYFSESTIEASVGENLKNQLIDRDIPSSSSGEDINDVVGCSENQNLAHSAVEHLMNRQIHREVPSSSSDKDIHDVVESSGDQNLVHSVGGNIINRQIHREIPNSSSDEYIHDVVESSEDQNLAHSLVENIVNRQVHREVPSSQSDEDIHDVVESPEEQNLSHSVEDKHSVISREVDLSEVSGQASTSQLTFNNSVEENTIDNVQSPNSDSDVYLEAREKLSLTPTTADVHASTFFHDKPMHQPSFKHLNVQAPKPVVESSSNLRTIQEVNMPVVQELDQDMLSNANSPLSPDFISIPSTSSETASPPADLQAVVEEVDEIKEIDEGMLSELDSVRDFSVKQWGSGSDESEKMVDSVGESSSLALHAETSAGAVVEDSSVEVTTTEHTIDSTNLREEMDVYEDMENISEIRTSERCIAEHIDISGKEYNERDGQDSPDQGSSDDDMSSTENEASVVYPVINEIHEAGDYGIPEAEGVIHNAETGASRAGSSELPSQGESEDIGLQSGQNTDSEIEKSVVLERPRAEVVIEQTKIEPEKSDVSGPTQAELVIKETVVDHDKFSDLELVQAERVIRETVNEHEISDLSETTQVELAIEESIAGNSEGQTEHGTSILVNTNQETPVVKVCSTGETSLDKKVVEPREIHETSTDLLVAESNPSIGTSAHPEKVLSNSTENQLETSPIVGSVQINTDRVDSLEPESSVVKEISVDHEVKEHKDSHSTKTSKGKGKVSKSSGSSSSSSSSSSSDSSSSDSDKE